jgi:hypothetical protein
MSLLYTPAFETKSCKNATISFATCGCLSAEPSIRMKQLEYQ